MEQNPYEAPQTPIAETKLEGLYRRALFVFIAGWAVLFGLCAIGAVVSIFVRIYVEQDRFRQTDNGNLDFAAIYALGAVALAWLARRAGRRNS